MSGPYFYYHLKFVKDTLTDCICVIQNLIVNIRDANLRNLKREQIDLGFYGLESLMCRVYTARKKYERLTAIKISLAMVLLKSELLERRIQGIKIISELCRSIHIFHFDMNKIYLLNQLKIPQIIEEIFGKRSHIQLVQRSSEILIFLMANNKLSKLELSFIWSCCDRDEQLRIEVFKVISDAVNYLPDNFFILIIDKYKNLKPNEVKDQDIQLLIKLAESESKILAENRVEALNIILKILLKEIGSPTKELYDKVLEVFCTIITTPNFITETTMHKYFKMAFTMIEKVMQSIIIV